MKTEKKETLFVTDELKRLATEGAAKKLTEFLKMTMLFGDIRVNASDEQVLLIHETIDLFEQADKLSD